MASRINSIITVADHKCTALLDTMPDGSKAKSNVEGINGVCRALLRRRTPLLPTARLVSEEGRKHNPHFPLERTIFNSYSAVLRIWKKAYHDVMNIDADPPISGEEVAKIDTSSMDPSIGNVVDRLKEIVVELTQRCNVLKQIIDEGVPVSPDDLPDHPEADDILQRLNSWVEMIASSGFQVDALSVKVSRRTPPGTRIMDGPLFNDLKRFAEDHALRRKTHQQSNRA